MKNIFIVIVIMALIIWGGAWVAKSVSVPQSTNNNNTANTEATDQTKTKVATAEDIAPLFAAKYNRPVSEVIVNVERVDGDYAAGSIGFKDELEGGIWYAARVDSQWKLVFDGNGQLNCVDVDYYHLPKTVATECMEESGEVRTL